LDQRSSAWHYYRDLGYRFHDCLERAASAHRGSSTSNSAFGFPLVGHQIDLSHRDSWVTRHAIRQPKCVRQHLCKQQPHNGRRPTKKALKSRRSILERQSSEQTLKIRAWNRRRGQGTAGPSGGNCSGRTVTSEAHLHNRTYFWYVRHSLLQPVSYTCKGLDLTLKACVTYAHSCQAFPITERRMEIVGVRVALHLLHGESQDTYPRPMYWPSTLLIVTDIREALLLYPTLLSTDSKR